MPQRSIVRYKLKKRRTRQLAEWRKRQQAEQATPEEQAKAAQTKPTAKKG